MNKLIEIKGQDLDKCICGDWKFQMHYDNGSGSCMMCDCKKFQSTGKSPTKIYFKKEDFKKCDCYKNHIKDCLCKGTGYLLPKKGDVICGNCGHLNHFLKDCPLCECENNKPFHLTKDAELKKVGDYYDFKEDGEKFKTFDWDKGLQMNITQFMKEHNLTEDSEIVLAEGYYE